MFSDSVCPALRKVFVASVFGACVFLIPNGVHSETSNSATLQWSANQESDLVGYRVYHGTTSGIYGSPQNAGTTPTYQYENLESNKTHYFSVTAYDSSGNESNPSPEVNTFIQAGVPPILTSPTPNSTLKSSTATFTWAANGTQVTEWWLDGTSQPRDPSEHADLFISGSLPSTVSSYTAAGLPTDGRTVYIQLWYRVNGVWDYQEFQFTAAAHISSFPLTISKSGDGSGTITSNPIGLNCGSTCTASFSTDSPVTLSANAASDSIFS
ncbi:MAG: fibronectin type III domain-containing protein, partial [Nitrospirota bacterium]|nr:fibronectin type III domain-containing protein [Nitrospirota bacterium]